MSTSRRTSEQGPFRAEHVRSGDRYELSKGHPIECAPTGGRGGRGYVQAGELLDSDPAVTESGIDVGYAPEAGTLRAPDVSIGNVPDRPGWVPGAPRLALEYADVGQDERDLSTKIEELLTAGTEVVWVVRLVGPRRVEEHKRGVPLRLVPAGATLVAPGILHNPVLVDALYDRQLAHAATFRNFLQRHGYETLDQVRTEGREEGLRGSLRAVLAARTLTLTPDDDARIDGCRDVEQLRGWLVRAVTAATARDVLAEK